MKPGKNPTSQSCENTHIKSHLIPRFSAMKLIDAAKAFQHISRVSVFPNILFLWFSKHKVTNPCKFSNFLPSPRPVEGLRSRIASIHVPPLSSLKQNKTYKEGKEGREGNTSSTRMKGAAQRVFVVRQWSLPLARML